MKRDAYSYSFKQEVDMTQVEEVLLLATAAAEGLHGRSRIQLEAAFQCNRGSRTSTVDSGTEVGCTIARIFTALLSTVIGEAAFRVERSVLATNT